MKNRSLFVLLAAVLPLFSCGTVGYTSMQGGGQFKNSIYYTPGSRSSAVQIAQQEEPAAVQQTQQGPASDTRTVYVGEANEVNINYEPGASYTIMEDDESYAARLRKFDSPTYTVNINTATGTDIGMIRGGVLQVGHGTVTGMTHGGALYTALYMHHGLDTDLQGDQGIIPDTADLAGMYIMVKEVQALLTMG